MTVLILSCEYCSGVFVIKGRLTLKKGYGRFCSNTCRHQSPQYRREISERRTGKKWTEVVKLSFSNKRKGSGNPNWRGGTTEKSKVIRNSREYKSWKLSVLKRDNHACVFCGEKKKLEVDHIKPQILYPDLRFDVSNGRTLCSTCHRKTPTYGPRVKLIKKES